jgi:transforming growth factor-beta-induced protein
MKRFFAIPLFVLVIASLVLSACAPAATPEPEPSQAPVLEPTAVPPTEAPVLNDIVDTAVADGRFTTLVAAVTAAGLVDALKAEGPLTVFAPTDDAFAKLPEGTVEALLQAENLEQLKNILLYHVVAGKVMAEDVVSLDKATTLLGEDLMVKTDMGSAYVNEAQVVITDIETSNGVIHVIDSVLLPPAEPSDIVDTAVADGRFTTLVAAVQAAGLVETLKGEGPFTVFAPTEEAFASLPEGTVEALLQPENLQKLTDILLYHVAPGKLMAEDVASMEEIETVLGPTLKVKVDMGNVYVNDAQIILADIEASNGVIHVIDAVLLPPADIVDTAIADGGFTTLVAALEAAGLVETLKGEGPFTVFAPTDDAFAKLPEGTVETLLKPENIEQLKNILLYHVVSGKVMAEEVLTLNSADTVLGQPVTIKVEDGKVYINDAQVTVTDIETRNGIIHVIDTVLLPPQ